MHTQDEEMTVDVHVYVDLLFKAVRTLQDALIDVVDGMSPEDVVEISGVSLARAEEILDIIDKPYASPQSRKRTARR